MGICEGGRNGLERESREWGDWYCFFVWWIDVLGLVMEIGEEEERWREREN